MSWTVACFCGTVFESPADRCPNCGTPVPELTTGEDPPSPRVTGELGELVVEAARVLDER
jgi:hypothetical protein